MMKSLPRPSYLTNSNVLFSFPELPLVSHNCVHNKRRGLHYKKAKQKRKNPISLSFTHFTYPVESNCWVQSSRQKAQFPNAPWRPRSPDCPAHLNRKWRSPHLYLWSRNSPVLPTASPISLSPAVPLWCHEVCQARRLIPQGKLSAPPADSSTPCSFCHNNAGDGHQLCIIRSCASWLAMAVSLTTEWGSTVFRNALKGPKHSWGTKTACGWMWDDEQFRGHHSLWTSATCTLLKLGPKNYCWVA